MGCNDLLDAVSGLGCRKVKFISEKSKDLGERLREKKEFTLLRWFLRSKKPGTVNSANHGLISRLTAQISIKMSFKSV